MGKPKVEKETGPSQTKQAEKAQSIVQKNYVVKGLVGKGSHGTVHKVRRIADGLICAMKECTVVHMSQEERDEAVKQIHLLSTVRHQNVIKYYDAFVEGDKLYTVMEYCERGDLAKLIRNRAQLFDESQIWSYFIQILRGIVALHSYQLIHRDIKSANVMLLDNNSIKIGDLGVPKLLKQSMGTTQIGTPHYMAPEIWKNEPYTFSSDMWALGCVLYELAALSIPFRGQTLFDLRAKLLQGEYPPIPAHFSSGLTTVLKHLLNTDQAWRLSSKEVLIHPLVRAHYHLAPPSIRLYVPRRKTMGEQPEPSSSPKSKIPKVNLARSATGLKVRAPSPVRIAIPTSNGPVVSVKRQSGVASVRVAAPRIAKSDVAAVVRPPRAVLSSRGNDAKPTTTVATKPVVESAESKPKPLGKPLPSLSPMVNNKRLNRLSLAGPRILSPKEQNAALNRRFKQAYVRSPEAPDTVAAVGSGEDDHHSQPSPTAAEPVSLTVSLSPRSPPSDVPAESTAVLESPQPPKVVEPPQSPKVLESPQLPKVLESPQPLKVDPPEKLLVSEKPKVLNGTPRNPTPAPSFVPRVRDAPIVLQPVATKIPSAPKSATPRAPLSTPRVPSPRAPLSAPKGPLTVASRSALGTSGTAKSPVSTPKAPSKGSLAAPKATPTLSRAPATASKIPQPPGLVPVKTKPTFQRKDEHSGKLAIAK